MIESRLGKRPPAADPAPVEARGPPVAPLEGQEAREAEDHPSGRTYRADGAIPAEISPSPGPDPGHAPEDPAPDGFYPIELRPGIWQMVRAPLQLAPPRTGRAGDPPEGP